MASIGCTIYKNSSEQVKVFYLLTLSGFFIQLVLQFNFFFIQLLKIPSKQKAENAILLLSVAPFYKYSILYMSFYLGKTINKILKCRILLVSSFNGSLFNVSVPLE